MLFIDDHPIYGDGLAFALTRSLPQVSVRVVTTGAAAIEHLSREDIDLVLSDYRLPDEDGLSLIQRMATLHPSVAMGLLCADATAELARRARAAGAVCCLSKERDMTLMADALAQVLGGALVFDARAPTAEQDGISDRRVEILRLAAEGLSNKHIARQLNVAERTVKDHWSIIFDRLGAQNRAQAVSLAYGRGLLRRDEN
ncbi:response regulator transcription factor [Nevskia ramosa]|uniref:response regulator transcription factor n=1 Tax=Nevskia ramosa TaxID=64002 RepID=UPI002354610F